MKKIHITIAIAGVLTLAYIGSTWYITTQVESRIENHFDQGIKALNTELAILSGIKDGDERAPQLKKIGHERGIFSSKTHYALIIDEQPQELEIINTVSYGPLPLAALTHGIFEPVIAFSKTTFQPTKKNADIINEIFNNQAPLVGYMHLNFDETLHFDWRIAPAKINSGIPSLNFAGLNLIGSVSPDGKEWNAKGNSSGLNLVFSYSHEIAYGALDYEFNTTHSPIGVNIGRNRITMTDFVLLKKFPPDFDENYKQNLSFQRMELQTSITVDGESSIGGGINYHIDGLQLNEKEVGDLSFDASVSHLDGLSIAALKQIYQQRDSNGKLPQRSSLSEWLRIPGVRENLIGALQQNPQMITTLNVTNTTGTSNLKITVDAGAATDPDRPGLETLKRAQVSLNLDTAMLNGYADEYATLSARIYFQQALRNIARSGFLTRSTDNQYIANINFENNILTINNNNIPLYIIPFILDLALNGNLEFINAQDLSKIPEDRFPTELREFPPMIEDILEALHFEAQ